ncbi:hypothetical protein ACE1ET_20195 [Saccharicrinis sp. FJH62]|uniref:hypothetical protein n=1 Tax=Saccharicrinis sp. FJH62 TaxID=3344657 RepID=UPI0035D48610
MRRKKIKLHKSLRPKEREQYLKEQLEIEKERERQLLNANGKLKRKHKPKNNYNPVNGITTKSSIWTIKK